MNGFNAFACHKIFFSHCSYLKSFTNRILMKSQFEHLFTLFGYTLHVIEFCTHTVKGALIVSP